MLALLSIGILSIRKSTWPHSGRSGSEIPFRISPTPLPPLPQTVTWRLGLTARKFDIGKSRIAPDREEPSSQVFLTLFLVRGGVGVDPPSVWN